MKRQPDSAGPCYLDWEMHKGETSRWSLPGCPATGPACRRFHAPRRAWRGTAVLLMLCCVIVISCNGATATPTPQDTIGIPPTWPPYTPLPTVVDTGLAYGAPCKPPCWQGLTPGKTTFPEAKAILEQLRATGPGYEVEIHEDKPQGFIFRPTPHDSPNVLVAGWFRFGILDYVTGDVAFDYTIGDVVAQFGPPEGLYLVSRSSTGCVSCDQVPSSVEQPLNETGVRLLYPSQGLYFSAYRPAGGLGCICPHMPVRGFCYNIPRSMQEMLQYSHKCDYVPDTATEGDLVEWHGFGGGY